MSQCLLGNFQNIFCPTLVRSKRGIGPDKEQRKCVQHFGFSILTDHERLQSAALITVFLYNFIYLQIWLIKKSFGATLHLKEWFRAATTLKAPAGKVNNTDHLCRQTVDATWHAPHTQTQLQYTALWQQHPRNTTKSTRPSPGLQIPPNQNQLSSCGMRWIMEAPIVTCRICCQCPGTIWWHHRTPLPVSMTCLARVKSDPWWGRHGSDLFWHVSRMLHQISIWGVSRQGWHLELYSSCLSHQS